MCAVVFIHIKTRARVVSLFAGDIKNSRPPVWCCCPNTIGGRLIRSVAEKEGRIVRQIWNTLAFQGKKEKENLTLPPKARPVVPVPPSSACACVSITKQCGGSENKKKKGVREFKELKPAHGDKAQIHTITGFWCRLFSGMCLCGAVLRPFQAEKGV